MKHVMKNRRKGRNAAKKGGGGKKEVEMEKEEKLSSFLFETLSCEHTISHRSRKPHWIIYSKQSEAENQFFVRILRTSTKFCDEKCKKKLWRSCDE